MESRYWGSRIRIYK